jgi:hypothetical protein
MRQRFPLQWHDPYETEVEPYPLMTIRNAREWLRQCEEFCNYGMVYAKPDAIIDPYFTEVAQPIFDAWRMYRDSAHEPLRSVRIAKAQSLLQDMCAAKDWTRACIEWLDRRLEINVA